MTASGTPDPRTFRCGHCDAFAIALMRRFKLPGGLIGIKVNDDLEEEGYVYEFAHAVAVIDADRGVVMDVDGVNTVDDLSQDMGFLAPADEILSEPHLGVVSEIEEDVFSAFTAEGLDEDMVEAANQVVDAAPETYRIPDRYRYPSDVRERDDWRLFKIVDTLLDSEGVPTWQAYVDRQEMGDCQNIAAEIERLNLPGVTRYHGPYRLDEDDPDLDHVVDPDEPRYVTHHWVLVDGETFDFAKGSLRGLNAIDDPYEVCPSLDEAERYDANPGAKLTP